MFFSWSSLRNKSGCCKKTARSSCIKLADFLSFDSLAKQLAMEVSLNDRNSVNVSAPYNPGLTINGYLSNILARSCPNLRTILAKILSRSCHGINFTMVRSYQESHVPKKNFIVKFYLARKNLKESQEKLTSMRIYIVRHDNLLFARYKFD